MALDNVKRSLSLTESIIVTSLNANGIDYKTKDENGMLNIIFSDEQKLNRALKLLQKKLSENNFDYRLEEISIFQGKEVIFSLWWEKIILKTDTVSNLLTKIKDFIVKILKK